MSKSLNELSEIAYNNAKAKGFYKKDLSFFDIFMRVKEEAIEAHKAYSSGKWSDLGHVNIIEAIDPENLPNNYEILKSHYEQGIKDTVEDEISDIFIILLGWCRRKNIDIDWHVEQKMRYNEGREYLHGKG